MSLSSRSSFTHASFHASCSNVCLGTWRHHKPSAIWFLNTPEKAEISTADISRTQGKRKKICIFYLRVNCPFKEKKTYDLGLQRGQPSKQLKKNIKSTNFSLIDVDSMNLKQDLIKSQVHIHLFY